MRPLFPTFASPLLISLVLASCSAPTNRKADTGDTGKNAAASVKPPDSVTANINSGPSDSTNGAAALLLRDPADRGTLSDGQTGMNIPPFGLADIRAALKHMRLVDDSTRGDAYTFSLSDSAYNFLSLPEKFTYNMIHAEQYSQMCDLLPEHVQEKDRIYGQTMDYLPEYSWSDRQINFFRANRDSVEKLMRTVIEEQHEVGLNTLDAIVEMNATEMISYLIETCDTDSASHYILTVLMLLMKKNNYPEFLSSISYSKLYDHDRDSYSRYLTYNKANQDLIILRAENYYKTLAPNH